MYIDGKLINGQQPGKDIENVDNYINFSTMEIRTDAMKRRLKQCATISKHEMMSIPVFGEMRQGMAISPAFQGSEQSEVDLFLVDALNLLGVALKGEKSFYESDLKQAEVGPTPGGDD